MFDLDGIDLHLAGVRVMLNNRLRWLPQTPAFMLGYAWLVFSDRNSGRGDWVLSCWVGPTLLAFEQWWATAEREMSEQELTTASGFEAEWGQHPS